MARAQIFGQAHGAGNVDAGRSAKAEALVLQQVEDGFDRLGVGDAVSKIDRRVFKIFRDAALADALSDGSAFGLQLAARVITVERRAEWVGQRDADLRVAGL